MDSNIANVKDCYGCGMCATVCSKNIISIRLNRDGFYEPFIVDIERCVNCGLCVEVCSYLHDKPAQQNAPLGCFGAWSKEHKVRRKCSSGGVGFELGRYLIGQGYKVCGVRYNAEVARAEHYIASTVEELISSIGSKYIPSYTLDAFRIIDRRKRYLVTGTPCQIDSFRRYIRRFKVEDNFVLLDFFCHGVPSMLMWQKYVAEVEKSIGKITYASWRNKFTGWHDSWAITMDGEEVGEKVDWHNSYNMLMREKKGFYNSRLSKGDTFYALFIGDTCLGKACYEHCKYKWNCSSADIRIGDMWGKTYAHEEDGVSAAIAFTSRGLNLLHQCNCELHEYSFDVVAESQMKQSARRPRIYDEVMADLKDPNVEIGVIGKKVKRMQLIKKVNYFVLHPKKFMFKIITKLIRK